MIYFTIYLKGLHNSTGYVDVALESDDLLKDYQNFLDMGIKAHKAYPIANPGAPDARAEPPVGKFVVNLSDIMAITVVPPSVAAKRRTVEIPPTVAY